MSVVDRGAVRTGDEVRAKGGIGWLSVTRILDEGVGGIDGGQAMRWVRWPQVTKHRKATT